MQDVSKSYMWVHKCKDTITILEQSVQIVLPPMLGMQYEDFVQEERNIMMQTNNLTPCPEECHNIPVWKLDHLKAWWVRDSAPHGLTDGVQCITSIDQLWLANCSVNRYNFLSNWFQLLIFALLLTFHDNPISIYLLVCLNRKSNLWSAPSNLL